MLSLNTVGLRTLVRGSLVASAVILTMYLVGGAALAAPAAPSVGLIAVAASDTETSTPNKNPYAGDEEKAAAGHKLYISYSCVSCHGQSGGGGMGPSLIDQGWRYGGTDADLFHSIHDGRPKGMPAWSSHLTDDQIWEVITFLRTISIAP